MDQLQWIYEMREEAELDWVNQELQELAEKKNLFENLACVFETLMLN